MVVRTGPHMNAGRVETHEFYIKVEVKADPFERIIVVSLYIPHRRSRGDDTAPMEEWTRQTSALGITVGAGDLNWAGTCEMQQEINGDVTNVDLIGAKVSADARDWRICSILHSGWTTARPRSGDWAKRTC